MPLLLIGAIVLVFLYWAGQKSGRINANRQRWTATLALLMAALLLVRGDLGLAVVAGAFGIYAMGQVSPYWRRLFAADADGEAPPGVSTRKVIRVRGATLPGRRGAPK